VQLTQQQAQLAQQVAPADRPRGARRATLEIEGELTVHTAAEHRGPLLELLEPEGELALDLSAVTELDTAGLQLLLLAQREAHHLGGRLVVTGATTGSEAPR
jgi:anti-sigma B factor antagonist